MNLIQQAEQLKMVPDQALAQMQQRPTDVPPYLVVAEMTRRMNMRKAYEAAQGQNPMNQPPVAQQVGQQFQQQAAPPPMGSPPPGMPAPQQPLRMAAGGLAAATSQPVANTPITGSFNAWTPTAMAMPSGGYQPPASSPVPTWAAPMPYEAPQSTQTPTGGFPVPYQTPTSSQPPTGGIPFPYQPPASSPPPTGGFPIPYQPPQTSQPPPAGGTPSQPWGSPLSPVPLKMADGGLADLTKYFQGMAGPEEMLPPVDPMMLGMGQFPGDPRWDEMRKRKTNPQKPDDWRVHLARIQEQMGESPLTAEAAKFEEQEKSLRGKKPGISQLLIQLGLGMAGSRRPDLMGMIAEGGTSALHGYTNERDRNTALADRAGARRLQALEGVQRHKDRIQDYAIDAARSAQSSYNTDRANDTNIELAVMRQQKEEELAQKLADRQITQQEAAMQLAMFNKGADEDRRLQEKAFDRDTQLLVQKLRNERPRGSGGKDTSAKDKIDQISKLARQFDMQAKDIDAAAAAAVLPDQKAALSKQAAEMRQRASAYREQLEFLITGERKGPASGSKEYTPEEILEMFKPAGEAKAKTAAKQPVSSRSIFDVLRGVSPESLQATPPFMESEAIKYPKRQINYQEPDLIQGQQRGSLSFDPQTGKVFRRPPAPVQQQPIPDFLKLR